VDLSNLFQQLIGFAQSEPVPTFAAAFVLICFLIWRPKLFFITLIVVLSAAAILYFVFEKISGMGLDR
jgi:hypothetical protein